MFEGKKTSVFWIGLLVLGLASVILFSVLWFTMVLGTPTNIDYYWKILTPPVAGSVVFILIGLYMMKSGTKIEEEGKTQLLTQ
jgi:O-antigen/teichoic acid export membrane protein